MGRWYVIITVMTALWFPLTLMSAFCLATSDALLKKALAAHNEYLVTWLRILPGLPIFLLPLPFLPIPDLSTEFFVCLCAGLPLEILALFLYSKALKLSPLNLTLPLLSLTPLLLLVVPFLLLRETVSVTGAGGIVLVAVGSYLLNARPGQGSVWAPLPALYTEKGSLCMIGVAAIYSVTSALGKRAITLSSPLFFAALDIPLLVLLTAPFALYKGKRELRGIFQDGTVAVSMLPAFFYAAQIVAHIFAIQHTNVAYMIAVKRLSLLFGVLYGRYLFQERGGVLASVIMLAGVFLIVLGE